MMNSADAAFHAFSESASSLSALLDSQILIQHGLSAPGAAIAGSFHEFQISPVLLFDDHEAWKSSLLADRGFDQALGAVSPVHPSATVFDAAAATPAFNPATFKINPSNPDAAAKQIAAAIEHGYSAAKAISLLLTDSAKVHVSFDDMLVLTESALKTETGAAVVAGEKAFVAEMKARLTSGAAATSLAELVHTGHLTAASGAAIIVSEAKDATPTVALEEHAVAQLLDALLAQHVAAAQVRLVAKDNAALIIAGIEKQSVLTAADLRAGERVFESELKTYSAAAAVTVEKQFAGLDRTEWATLTAIETIALKDAVADKVLTQAGANAWTVALDAAQVRAAANLVDPIALKLAAGAITDTTATQDLKVMASTQAKADALLLAAVEANPIDSTADALGELTISASLNGAINTAGLNGSLDHLVADVLSKSSVTGVNGLVLSHILQRAVAFGTITDAQAYTDIVKASNTDTVDGPDQWLLATANSLGGPTGAHNAGYVQPFLAIDNAMAARVKSGAFLAGVIKEYASGKMALASADTYIQAYAHLAMANDYSVTDENRLADPELTQVDGVTSDDRIGDELIKFIAGAPKADTAAVTTYVEKNNIDFYLTGLGFTGAMGNDKSMAANVVLANEVIKASYMAGVVAAGKNAGSGTVSGITQITLANDAIYNTASADAAAAAQDFANGVDSYIDDAKALSTSATASPPGSLIQNIQDIGSDPGNFSNFEALAAQGLGYVLGGDSPLSIAVSAIQAGAGVLDFILDKTGLGNLLGPIGGGLEDLAGFVGGGSGIISTALQGFLVAPAADMIIGIGTTLLDVGKNLGDMVADVFTGNFYGAGQAAEALGTDLENDVGNIADAVTQDMLNTATALYNDVVNIANALVSTVETLENIFSSAVDAVENGFDTVWGDVESLY